MGQLFPNKELFPNNLLCFPLNIPISFQLTFNALICFSSHFCPSDQLLSSNFCWPEKNTHHSTTHWWRREAEGKEPLRKELLLELREGSLGSSLDEDYCVDYYVVEVFKIIVCGFGRVCVYVCSNSECHVSHVVWLALPRLAFLLQTMCKASCKKKTMAFCDHHSYMFWAFVGMLWEVHLNAV